MPEVSITGPSVSVVVQTGLYLYKPRFYDKICFFVFSEFLGGQLLLSCHCFIHVSVDYGDIDKKH